jgi:hypothetical protein
MSTKSKPVSGLAFLKALWRDCPGGFIDMRAIPVGGGKPIQKFVTTDAEIATFASTYGQKGSNHSVFFGVAKRTKASGKADSVQNVPALWADIDSLKDGIELADVYAKLASLPPDLQPSAVIESGGGLHCYWFLDRIDESLPNIVSGNELVRDLVGGDNVQDVTRVLRLPDTYNNKRTKKTLCQVRFLREHRRVCLANFTHKVETFGKTMFGGSLRAPYVTTNPTPERAIYKALHAGRHRKAIADMDGFWRDQVRHKAPANYIGIHEASLRTAAILYCHGITDDMIVNSIVRHIDRRRELDAPGETWDMTAEAKTVRKQLEDWKPKWAFLKAQHEARRRAERSKNEQPSQARHGGVGSSAQRGKGRSALPSRG